MALTQAQQLTRWVTRKGHRTRVLAITSGKGGVGKTNVTVNLACRLADRGYRVMILDGDMGLGNVDVRLGLSPDRTLADVLGGKARLDDVILTGPHGVRIVPSGSGITRLTHLGEEGQLLLLSQVAALGDPPDYLILDTGAGIGDNVRFLAGCAQEILVVVTPEPTAITDAYALMKVMATHHGEKRFRLLVNQTAGEAEALEVYRRLSLAGDRFLGAAVDFAGGIPADEAVAEAVRAQRVFATGDAGGASLAFTQLARTVEGWSNAFQLKGGVQFLFNRAGGQLHPAAAHTGG